VHGSAQGAGEPEIEVFSPGQEAPVCAGPRVRFILAVQVLKFLWKQQISAIPPEAVPYMTGEYIMNTDRLRRFLGPEYDHVMRYTIADAFADSVRRADAASA